MKIIRKTVLKAFKNWEPDPSIRCYHYAAAFSGKRMVAFAKNNPNKTHARVYRLGGKFNVPKYQEYSFYHAETHLVTKLLDKYNYIDDSLRIVVLRINRLGVILGSQPCENCSKVLEAVNLTNIWYSRDDGLFEHSSGKIVRLPEYALV